MQWEIDIARVCHEANRALCGTLDEDIQLPWEDCPQWQRDSARDNVLKILNSPNADSGVDVETHAELSGTQQIKDRLFFGIVQALRGFVE